MRYFFNQERIFGSNIAKRLFRLGLTQKDLADAIGTSQQNLAMVLAGKRYSRRVRREAMHVLEQWERQAEEKFQKRKGY